MDYRILGPLQVVAEDGRALAFGPRQQRLLVMLLLSAGRSVPHHELVDGLWDEEPPTTARRQIQNAIWMLRKDLPIVTDSLGYRIELRPGQLDAQNFRDATARAHTLAGSGQVERALTDLNNALALWRGPALAGCTGARIEAAASKLDDLRLSALEQRLDLELVLGRHSLAVTELAHLVDDHPLREPLVGLLMRALHGLGRQAEALAAYQRLRLRLADELGVDPGPPLRDLHTRILRDELAAPRARDRSRVWGLPHRLPHFTGRAGELAWIHDGHARGGRPDIVAVWGMRGAGKTSLAIEYAHRAAADRTLVAWLAASDRGALLANLAELGRAIGISGGGHDEIVRRTLSGLDTRSPWLLVYDDADPDTVRDLLPTSGGGNVLITSRRRDWTDIGEALELGMMPDDDAVTLLLARSGDVSAEAAEHARLLAHRLGGLPLALDLAGAYCRGSCTLADYHGIVERTGAKLLHPKLLTRISGGVDGATAQLFTLLAWFAPGYLPQSTIGDNSALLPSPLRSAVDDPALWHDILDELSAAGLIRVEPGRVWSHQLVQEVQRARAGEASWWRRRHDRAWKTLVTELVTADFPLAYNDTAVWEHCAALLPHANAVLDPEFLPRALLGELADRVIGYHLAQGRYAIARELSRQALQSRTQMLGLEHHSALRAMNYLALATHRIGDYSAATELHRLELDLSREVLGANHPGTLSSMHNYAKALDGQGQFEAARELTEQVLYAKRRLLGSSDPRTLATLNNLANLLFRLKRYAQARELIRGALDRRHRVLGPDHVNTWQSMNNLANVMHTLGENEDAARLHRRVAATRQRVLGAAHPDTLISLSNLANVMHSLGSHDSARDLHRFVFDTRWRTLGTDHPQTFNSMHNFARALDGLGESEAAQLMRAQARSGRGKILGATHPQTLMSPDEPVDTPNNTEEEK